MLIVSVLSGSSLPCNFVVRAVTQTDVPEAHDSHCRDPKSETWKSALWQRTVCVCVCMCVVCCVTLTISKLSSCRSAKL